MKKAIVIYHSKTGITRKFAENIGRYLSENSISAQVSSIEEVSDYSLSGFDYVLLGCWTSGLYFFMQKPQKIWADFATKLSVPDNPKLVLFTTFKIRTGSMFRNMKKHLKLKHENTVLELKSRNGELEETTQMQLETFIK